MIKLYLPCALPGRERRGCENSLSTSKGDLRRDASAAGVVLDHPGKNCRCFDEDALLLSEGSHRIPRNLNGLMSVMRHVASLQGGVVHYVAVVLRPALKKINGIDQVRDFSDQVPFLLQVNRSSKRLRVHFTLTDYDGVYQRRRCGPAPGVDLLSLFSGFKRFGVRSSSLLVGGAS